MFTSQKQNETPKEALLVVLLCVLAPSTIYAQSPGENELIVRLEDESSSLQQTLQKGTVPKRSGDSLFANVQSISSVFGRTDADPKEGRGGRTDVPIDAFRLTVPDSSSLRRLQRRWQQKPEVRYAHPNYEFRLTQASGASGNRADPVLVEENVLADSLDHLEVVRALDAWPMTTGASDVRIGVVDTGFFLGHPDLENQFWINEDEDVNGNGEFDPFPVEEGGDFNGVDDDGNGFVDDVIGYDFVDRSSPIDEGEFEERDPDPSADPKGFFSWHGTSVAAIATAAPSNPREGIAGVAPNTRLVGLRAFGGDGRALTDDIAAAIVYAAERNLDVVNLSFGRDRDVPLIEDAVEFAHEQGTVVVASAGNEFTDDPHYPSDYPEALSVVWLGEDGSLPQFNRSQFGIGVDLGAPGSNVFTADFPADEIEQEERLSREDLYRSPDGSSFSAPQVAGAAALLRSADSSLSPASIRRILTASADDIEGANWDHKTGSGLLNVAQSLSRAYPARTEIDRPEHNAGVRGQAPVLVTGTTVDPAFDQYALYFARGTKDFDERTDPWNEITPPVKQQVLRDTLGVWSTGNLEEGNYTLRLVTRLRDGRTIEDRRRVRIDNSPPTLDVTFLGTGRVAGENGVIADVATDDVTRLRLRVDLGSRTEMIRSDTRARRQGISWADERGTGGRAGVRLEATNASGLATTIDTTLRVPDDRENTALLERTITALPRGRLLPETVDFDEDGLREVVLNQFVEGGASDTLRSFEWAGSELAPADTLVPGTLLPKDAGDTNGDGLQELLLQVRGATFLLEQPSSAAFPTDLIFADTSRISDAPGDTLDGTLLTDLDADGRGEVVGTDDRQWRVVERKESGFQEIARLENPTRLGPDSSLGNLFDFQKAQTGDFDGDGRRDLLVGDRDGDVIVYEARGDDRIEVAWTAETERVNAGTRFAAGDFSGTGRTDFVTMTTNPLGTLPGGGVAPPVSFYSVWRRVGNDAYERSFRLPIQGAFTRQGSLAAADVDTDGRPEVVIAHPPSLLVLDRPTGENWRVLFEDRNSSILSRSILAADVSGSGTPSVLAGTNDGQLLRYVVNTSGLAVSPPRWVRARPGGATTTRLAWRAPGADSVSVFAGAPDGELDRVLTTRDSTVRIDGTAPRRFALRAWEGGRSSPLSTEREIRPHRPATVAEVTYPNPPSVRLQFTDPLSSDTRAEQFRFGSDDLVPRRLTRARNGTGVVLHFSRDVLGRTGRLRWRDVTDMTGLPVGQTGAEISFPSAERRSLIVETAMILDENRLRLTFNEPIDPTEAREEDRYEVQPRGRVSNVQQENAPSSTVTLRVAGLPIGARGAEASLTVTDMTSTTGSRLAEEGRTVRLTKPADDLSNVFVYPNPFKTQRHGEDLTIAGLPSKATIRIFTPAGRLVRVLSVENDRDGGRDWDLRDRRGERVPSGVYLIRVNAPDHSPVLEKAAVVR